MKQSFTGVSSQIAKMENFVKIETRSLFSKNAQSKMFDYVLNTRLSFIVKEVSVDEKPISLIRLKNQQKIKALLNSTDRVLVLPRSRSRRIL